MSRYLDPKADVVFKKIFGDHPHLLEIDEKTVTVAQELLDVPEISEAVILAEESAYTLGELNSYESYWDAVRTEKTKLIDSFEMGMTKGIEKGKKETQEEIARNLLKAGVDYSVIALATKLTVEQIKSLK